MATETVTLQDSATDPDALDKGCFGLTSARLVIDLSTSPDEQAFDLLCMLGNALAVFDAIAAGSATAALGGRPGGFHRFPRKSEGGPSGAHRCTGAGTGAAMLIDIAEVFVVKQLDQAAPAGAGGQAWHDVREFDEDGPAFDLADYLREDGETVARVVRRWR